MNTKGRQGQVKAAAVGKKPSPKHHPSKHFDWAISQQENSMKGKKAGRISQNKKTFLRKKNRPKKSKSVIALKYLCIYIYICDFQMCSKVFILALFQDHI